MNTIKLTPKRDKDSYNLAEYVYGAYCFACEIKQDVHNSIMQTDQYFKSRENVSDCVVTMHNEDGTACNDESKFLIHLDAISDKIDAFMAVSSDAIIQVDKPWVISPTEIPDISEGDKERIKSAIIGVIGEQMAAISNGDEEIYYRSLTSMLADKDNAYDYIREQRDEIYALINKSVTEKAAATAKALDALVYDDIQESNWEHQLNAFIFNMAKYDFAVMKSPMYVKDYKEKIADGKISEVSTTSLTAQNIHPANYFCSEDSTWGEHGTFEMDLSSISLNDLQMSIGFDGFVESEIKACIEHFKDTRRVWIDRDDDTSDFEEWKPYEHISIIKYHGRIAADLIYEHVTAAQKKKIKDSKLGKNASFECTVWIIDKFAVFQTVTLSNIVRRPYRVATYSKRGSHKYHGKGLYSICINYQLQMDKFYNMMLENANLAAGGIVGYDRKKIMLDEFHPQDIKGGLRVPVKSSYSDGGNNRPIFEIRFDSHVSEFFGIITQIEDKMDKRSQIPSSAVGFGSKISSIRSTGIASLNQQAIHKSVIMKVINIERQVIRPMVSDAISYHLWNTDNREILNGAVDVRVAGYSEIIRTEGKQQNLDLFIQNIIGMQNAINGMKAQGQDVSGIIGLTKKYTEQAGFDSEQFFSDDVQQVAGELAGNVSDGVPANIINDGRVGINEPSQI